MTLNCPGIGDLNLWNGKSCYFKENCGKSSLFHKIIMIIFLFTEGKNPVKHGLSIQLFLRLKSMGEAGALKIGIIR